MGSWGHFCGSAEEFQLDEKMEALDHWNSQPGCLLAAACQMRARYGVQSGMLKRPAA